ncbi:MAG: hypothetical protein EAZ42_10275 [Verrucomicrobia bacterium]|nr:MAG: hypothetical protein EAZ42_10275 [Verrucomicrobiota bacterium]
MRSLDDIQYAVETTKVLHEPDRRIKTFGETRFEFQLITELMDEVGLVRIRSGEIEAARPLILRPTAPLDVELDGFDDSMRAHLEKMLDQLRASGGNLAFLQYGFTIRRQNLREQIVKESLESVKERALDAVRISGNPSLAIIEGVDDAWEISLLKFSFDMILSSHGINAFDFKRRGLL